MRERERDSGFDVAFLVNSVSLAFWAQEESGSHFFGAPAAAAAVVVAVSQMEEAVLDSYRGKTREMTETLSLTFSDAARIVTFKRREEEEEEESRRHFVCQAPNSHRWLH